MKAVVQRVTEAKVSIGERVAGEIEGGIMVLLGVMEGDTAEDATLLAEKVAALRIFGDDAGKMNLSLLDVGGEALVVSQFTLAADCRHGRRPSFIKAAAPAEAKFLYEMFKLELKNCGVKNVPSGEFGADMQVSLVNDGPVTIILDTDELKKKAKEK